MAKKRESSFREALRSLASFTLDAPISIHINISVE
uniref:Uncharacterized protein n=1 Tax=Lepeophtheirus salmonis TaxID=72036 RepID=A0A0K2UF45_LEPSM